MPRRQCTAASGFFAHSYDDTMQFRSRSVSIAPFRFPPPPHFFSFPARLARAARWPATKSATFTLADVRGCGGRPGGVRRRHADVSAGPACVAVTLRSRVTTFFLSYQTYANSRRDATRRDATWRGGRDAVIAVAAAAR